MNYNKIKKNEDILIDYQGILVSNISNIRYKRKSFFYLSTILPLSFKQIYRMIAIYSSTSI